MDKLTNNYLTNVTIEAVERALKIRARLKEMARTPFMQERVALSQLIKDWPTMSPEQRMAAEPFLMQMQARYRKGGQSAAT